MNCKEEKILIGGIKQSIFTMLTDKSNPVLLIVHGGPGSPDRPLVKRYNSDLANYFTVVCWDQRCSGLSYTKESKEKTLTTELMLNDLKGITEYLLKAYGKEKLYLAGHSWGAYLGLWFASLYPEYLYYYIGTGQGISSKKDEIEKYNFVLSQAQKANDKKSIKKLLKYGEPVNGVYENNSGEAIDFVGKLIHKYSGYIHNENSFSMKKYLSVYIKHYGVNTFKVIGGINYSVKQLIPKMKENDVLPYISRMEVPVLLVFGEADYICPVATAKEWFDKLEAPEKKFVVIEKAAHMVNFEQSEQWNEAVIKCIKK